MTTVCFHCLPVGGDRTRMRQQPCDHQLTDHRWYAARVLVVLSQILSGGLEVHKQRHIVADLLPVGIV